MNWSSALSTLQVKFLHDQNILYSCHAKYATGGTKNLFVPAEDNFFQKGVDRKVEK